jgi:uncharacterized membrane protein YedE/YeeE
MQTTTHERTLRLDQPGTEEGQPATPPAPEAAARQKGLLVYLLLGVLFGIVLTKSEVISWFRIQEMFRFQSFHMYGIIGAAVVVAALSVALIKKLDLRTVRGEPIRIPPKEMGTGYRYWIGGTIFGLGWALLGACPGPIFALLGNGVLVIVVALASALAGTWAYGYLRPHLPH